MSTPSRAGAGAKTMSSRLANMKFMQRSGASESPAPGTPEQPSSKRQRMSNGTYNSSPGSTPGSEQPKIHTPEEKKRMEASEREAAAKGETKWYLSVKQAPKPTEQSPLRIISTGYGALDSGRGAQYSDSGEEEEDVPVTTNAPGRMNFGNFNKKQPKPQQDSGSSGESSSESESESDEDDGDDPTGAKALIKQSRKEAGDRARAERKAQRKAEKKEAARLADSRRKKEVNLNKVTSISGSGKPSASAASMVCHNCGKKGHIKAQCPSASKRSSKGLNY